MIKLGDSVREVQYECMEETIKIFSFLSLSPHHTRVLQFISVNKQSISSCELHKEAQDMFRRVNNFQDWKSSPKSVGLEGWYPNQLSRLVLSLTG